MSWVASGCGGTATDGGQGADAGARADAAGSDAGAAGAGDGGAQVRERDGGAACAGFGCDHGGRCVLGGAGEPECDCPPGFRGERCELEPEDCEPNPCQNGGSCALSGLGAPECECVDSYHGEHCELAPDSTHCVLDYELVLGNGDDGDAATGSNIRIRDTAFAIGDGTHAAGPGRLLLRVPSDGAGGPAAGPVELLYYHLPQQFETTSAGITIATAVEAFSPALDALDNTTAVARGTLSLGATPAIEWAACEYPAGHDDSTTSFTPDVQGTGPGCLSPYRSVGNVHCTDASMLADCSTGGLDAGDNPQDETWEQALEPFSFTRELQSFSMAFMRVPNRSPSRTAIRWGGALKSIDCD